MSVRKSRENYRQIYGKSKASLWRNLSTGTPPKCFRTILCFVALVYNWFFFSEQPFYGIYSTLDSHTNTVISHTFAKVYSKKNNSCFCIPGLQENSDILRLPLFWDWKSVLVNILVGFPDVASAFTTQSLLGVVFETSCLSS